MYNYLDYLSNQAKEANTLGIDISNSRCVAINNTIKRMTTSKICSMFVNEDYFLLSDPTSEEINTIKRLNKDMVSCNVEDIIKSWEIGTLEKEYYYYLSEKHDFSKRLVCRNIKLSPKIEYHKYEEINKCTFQRFINCCVYHTNLLLFNNENVEYLRIKKSITPA